MGNGKSHLSQLWQWPLLLFSIFLFGYGAYLFIDPKPGPTAAQKIESIRKLLDQDRGEAALDRINGMLSTDKLTKVQEGAVRMLRGEAFELLQKQKHVSIPSNYREIIQQTKLAVALGIEADTAVYRRLAESFEALGQSEDAILHYRQLLAKDTSHGLKWQRRIIELQLVQEDR